jgi:hypothetical protein
MDMTTVEAGSAAEFAAARKMSKYQGIAERYDFVPLAFESHGAMSEASKELLKVLGHRLATRSGDLRETAYLFQRISVILQQYNAVLLHDTFNIEDHPG